MSTHPTAAELVAAWDRGHIIGTIEMGGLGPGYEQAIQVFAVECTRDALAACAAGRDVTGTEADWRKHCEATLATHDRALGGLSGAQFGAGEWLAHQWMTVGPVALREKTRAKDGDDRLIIVSQHWPRAAERAA